MKKLLLTSMCVFITGCVHNTYLQSEPKEDPATLGMHYLTGRGVPQSDTKAFEYLKEAADEDDPFAQNEVAYLYAAGKGTSRNYVKAYEYYQKAANHGLASAQYNLGMLYQHGLGTSPNMATACYLFRQSASHGFEPAKQALSQCHSSRKI